MKKSNEQICYDFVRKQVRKHFKIIHMVEVFAVLVTIGTVLSAIVGMNHLTALGILYSTMLIGLVLFMEHILHKKVVQTVEGLPKAARALIESTVRIDELRRKK